MPTADNNDDKPTASPTPGPTPVEENASAAQEGASNEPAAGGGSATPTLYTARFVFEDDNEPLKDMFLYLDVPGDNKFLMESRWKTGPNGQAGKVLENTNYNFFYHAKSREKAWLEKTLTEAQCTNVTTGSAKDGVVEVKLKRPKFEIELNGSAKPEAHYLGWAPSIGKLKQTVEGTPACEVTLKYKVAKTSGKLTFYKDGVDSPGADMMTIMVPPGKQEVEFYVGGKFGWPSHVTSGATPSVAAREDDKDTQLQVMCNGLVLAELPVFIRVRTNANKLTPAERDRFLNAMGALKAGSNFKKIEQMHNSKVQGLIHGGPSFLAWHRAYLLDLERELQAVDPTVCLHYWNFEEESWNDSGDKVALFTENFIGRVEKVSGTWEVSFASSNPLSSAKHDWGSISRMPSWDPSHTKKGGVNIPPGWSGPLNSEAVVIASRNQHIIEGDPHNPAHAKMMGDLGGVNTAPKDPLFFMLHSNVDRLWGEWQVAHKAWDAASNDYSSGTNSSRTPWSDIDGHRLGDSMWPWDGKTGSGRGTYDRPPGKAPGSGLAESPAAEYPTDRKAFTLGDMLDYQGRKDPKKRLGMDYDTISFTKGN
jgi:tyrosinase